ncbi:MAG: glycoside hydrolase family 3 C-terminal domain-containing protein [Actinomycetota bacterium]|nr:glycoside hydrolase family 3 C-terminal domain-containing protein [Actinomycetota bacterium]
MPAEPSAIDALVAALSLEEKAGLTAGVDNWSTMPVPRLGIPAVYLSDGPVGARGHTVDHESATTSVCVISPTAMGASFDPELTARMSAIVARQAREKGARVLLAPTVNLHRHPLWGRNFEAFSEDPVLTGKLAVAYIAGVQGEGQAATIKHFVANEAEFERFTSSSDLDERTLRELYLLPFEYGVRHAKVWTLMTSYNRVNGAHVPDQRRLIGEILRDEWDFDGLVMTDWWAIIDTELAGEAGLDLEMPGPARAFGPALAAAVREGRVSEQALDAKVRRLFVLFDRLGLLDEALASLASGGPAAAVASERPAEHPEDRAEDRAALRAAAAQSTVLLTNDGILPLAPGAIGSIALLGPRAEFPAIMGGGSAKVRPHARASLLDALRERMGATVTVHHEAAGDPDGIARAAELAASCDVAIVVVGTDDTIESEGFDRTTMDLPAHQDELVERVLAANQRTIVVVSSGAPVTMPWASRPAALIQAFYGGQELGNGLADVLSGAAEPGGRLPTTLPLRLEHTPAYGSFPGESSHVRYGEGLLIGYRWYETRQLPVAFCFGHGLSYTTFSIGEARVSTTEMHRGEQVVVEVPVTNTGKRTGSEVVQCYVAPPGGGRLEPGGRLRAPKELRAFAKVVLEPNASTTVRFELSERSFAYYDTTDEDWLALEPRRAHPAAPLPPAAHKRAPGWYVAPGRYELCIGRSSADITQRVAVTLEGGDEPLDPALLPD